jgi:hypothetical protein
MLTKILAFIFLFEYCWTNPIQSNFTDFKEAVRANDQNRVQQLLQPYDINTQLDSIGNTALNYAINLPEMLDNLLNNGADYTNLQNSILCPILKFNYVESRDLLLRRDDVNVNEICNEKMETTPLYEAIDAQNIESVRILLDKGADSSHKSNERNRAINVLQWAIKRAEENTEIIKVILENSKGTGNLNIDYQDSDGRTSLNYAAGVSNDFAEEIIVLLMKDYNADASIKNNENKTPAEVATEYDHFFAAHIISRCHENRQDCEPISLKMKALRKKTANSTSKIQQYVDYVIDFPKFEDIADPESKKQVAKWGLKRNFDEQDKKIEKVRKRAQKWNSDVSISGTVYK